MLAVISYYNGIEGQVDHLVLYLLGNLNKGTIVYYRHILNLILSDLGRKRLHPFAKDQRCVCKPFWITKESDKI